MHKEIQRREYKDKGAYSELISQYGRTFIKDLHEALKDLFGGTIQGMLEAELDNEKQVLLNMAGTFHIAVKRA